MGHSDVVAVMLTAITGIFGRKAIMAGLAVVALAATVMWLRHDAAQDERARAEAERLRQHTETLERISDAISDTRTPDDIRERLRNLAR